MPRSSTSGRTWSAGSGCAFAGRGRDGGRRPARRGAGARRAGRPAAAQRRRRPTATSWRAAPRRCSSRASPSTASATPRSAACRTQRRGRRGGRRRLGPAPHRLVRLLETICSTASTRTSSGACAATSSTSRPTARSATSASAGPATSRSSRRPPRFLFDIAGLPELLAGRPGRRAGPDGAVPTSSPSVRAATSTRRPAGAMPPRSCRGCSTSARATRRARAPAREHAHLGGPGSPRWPARTGCGPAASSSATGSTRPRRPTSPPSAGRPRCRRHRLPRPVGRPAWPRRRSCSAGSTIAAEYAASRRARSAVRSRASTSRPAAACSATARPSTRSPSRGRCCRRASSAAHGGRRLADLCAGGRLPHRHRLSRHAAGLRRAVRGRPRDVAYRLLLQTRLPVLALPGDDGRDDVWERWDSMLPDGRSTRAR